MKRLTLKTGILCALVWLMPSMAITNDPPVSFDKQWTGATYAFVLQALPQMQIPFQAQYEEKIIDWIRLYMTRGSRSFEKMMSEFPYYFPIFEEALNKEGLPAELKYLALVESGLIPDIESKAGAGGLWQFMPNTARHYGLEMNERVDERFDPHLSSTAAAAMLRSLYDQFGDWKLVLAAYNCGPGRVRKAIRITGSSAYEDIRGLLPDQTRNYLIKYTAAAFVSIHHELLGLQPGKGKAGYQEFAVMKVHEEMSFETIIEATGITEAELQRLNPAYKQGILPASETGSFLILPAALALVFEQFLADRGVEIPSYLSGEPERPKKTATQPAQYWVSAYVKPLPPEGFLQFNLQGLLSWTYDWGLSLFHLSIFS